MSISWFNQVFLSITILDYHTRPQVVPACQNHIKIPKQNLLLQCVRHKRDIPMCLSEILIKSLKGIKRPILGLKVWCKGVKDCYFNRSIHACKMIFRKIWARINGPRLKTHTTYTWSLLSSMTSFSRPLFDIFNVIDQLKKCYFITC